MPATMKKTKSSTATDTLRQKSKDKSVISGGHLVAKALKNEGVDTIFGYSGGAILPTYDAVFRYNQENAPEGEAAMSLIVPANEQGACFMASGYARATGRIGVVIVTSGPGATNCVTPVRDCIADSIPIVRSIVEISNCAFDLNFGSAT